MLMCETGSAVGSLAKICVPFTCIFFVVFVRLGHPVVFRVSFSNKI